MPTDNTYNYKNGIQGNNRKVLQELIHQFRPKIIAYLKTKGARKEDGEDYFFIGLETVVEKIIKNPAFLLPDNKFYAYLKRVCHNKWVDFLKKGGNNYSLEEIPELLADEFPFQEEDLVLKEFITKFNQLGEDCKDVLWYFIIHKMKDKEIANLKKYTVDFVRQKRRRCREKLK